MALGVDPQSISVPDGERWSGALSRLWSSVYERWTATIVAIADGTVSMYLSSGGGVIGAGEHAAVRNAADHFRRVVADVRPGSGDPVSCPLPGRRPGPVPRPELDGAFSGRPLKRAPNGPASPGAALRSRSGPPDGGPPRVAGLNRRSSRRLAHPAFGQIILWGLLGQIDRAAASREERPLVAEANGSVKWTRFRRIGASGGARFWPNSPGEKIWPSRRRRRRGRTGGRRWLERA